MYLCTLQFKHDYFSNLQHEVEYIGRGGCQGNQNQLQKKNIQYTHLYIMIGAVFMMVPKGITTHVGHLRHLKF